MALAGTGGQGWTSSMGRGLGMGEMVWRWCEYKGVNEPLSYTTHHTHLQGPKGEESNLGNGNYRCATGGRSWMRRRDLLIHWESMNIKVIVHTSYPQQPMGRSRGRESEGQHKGLLYNTDNKPTTFMHSP